MQQAMKDGFTLGIYGDGQLALFCALKAKDLGIKLVFFTLDEKQSPCKNLGQFIEGKSWDDQAAFQEFLGLVHIIVLENEFIPASFLLEAQETGVESVPNARSYASISDKLKQIKIAERLGINVPRYSLIKNESDIDKVPLPSMIKSLRNGYDGYGNFLLDTEQKRSEAKVFIKNKGEAVAQEFIQFQHETAILVVRNSKNTFTYPPVETIQENNICHYVITPPRFSSELQALIEESAKKIITEIDGIGVFGIEFFIKDGQLIFNEIAPRAHNSGHYTMDACEVSQFENILKIALKLEVDKPKMKVDACGMLNLLGTQSGKMHFQGDERFHHNAKGFLHFYGKEKSRPGRKMGHYTLLGADAKRILQELSELKNGYEI